MSDEYDQEGNSMRNRCFGGLARPCGGKARVCLKGAPGSMPCPCHHLFVSDIVSSSKSLLCLIHCFPSCIPLTITHLKPVLKRLYADDHDLCRWALTYRPQSKTHHALLRTASNFPTHFKPNVHLTPPVLVPTPYHAACLMTLGIPSALGTGHAHISRPR